MLLLGLLVKQFVCKCFSNSVKYNKRFKFGIRVRGVEVIALKNTEMDWAL